MDDEGFMYYITKQQGHFKINEIDPFNDHVHEHRMIYEIKSEYCYGFYCEEKYFYFIGDNKILVRLKRQQESRQLFEENHYQMKDKDRPNFSSDDQFGDIILNSQYIIQKAQLFYITDNNKKVK